MINSAPFDGVADEQYRCNEKRETRDRHSHIGPIERRFSPFLRIKALSIGGAHTVQLHGLDVERRLFIRAALNAHLLPHVEAHANDPKQPQQIIKRCRRAYCLVERLHEIEFRVAHVQPMRSDVAKCRLVGFRSIHADVIRVGTQRIRRAPFEKLTHWIGVRSFLLGESV